MTSDASNIVLPGGKIGVLGSGQLGRMMAIAAKQMGYTFHVYSNAPGSPAGQLADSETVGELEDLTAIRSFAKSVDVLTIETENIPLETFQTAASVTRAYPGPRALEVAQNRVLEKQFVANHGIPTCQFQVIRSLDDLKNAVSQILPGVLKTTMGGYDGKGQVVICTVEEVEEAWDSLQAEEAIFESWVEYDFEFSVIGARTRDGRFTAYPSVRNDHQKQILDVSSTPSGLSEAMNDFAADAVHKIMDELEAVGVLAVEFFCAEDQVLFNEMAPRPHNSGHLTIEGHRTSQFEQHIRAICGLKLGSTELLTPTAMANILGDEWNNGEPNWEAAISDENTKLHLYGKKDPKPGRKMGHLTQRATTVELAKSEVQQSRGRLNQLVSSH